MFTLNPHSGIPMYRQLQDQVKRLVASGQLQLGAELPSVRELALAHAINPMTISKAYSLLEAEGILVRHRGKPMTVAAQPKAHSQPSKRLQHIEPHLDALILAARQLEIGESEVVRALKKRWEKEDA
jgi:GntR family transcriptional regulator